MTVCRTAASAVRPFGWDRDRLGLRTQLAKMTRWFAPAEVLTMATATNAELLALSVPRNPYPRKLRVIEDGALADLLVFNGNPLEDISLLERPDESLAVLVKDGEVIKNTLGITAPAGLPHPLPTRMRRPAPAGAHHDCEGKPHSGAPGSMGSDPVR